MLHPRLRIALSIGVASCLSGACVSTTAHEAVVNQAQHYARTVDELSNHNQSLQDENARLKARARELEGRAVDAEWVKEQKSRLEKLMKEFEGQGGAASIPGVQVIPTAEGVGFQIEGEVLFASGKAEITTQGKSTLDRLAPILKNDARAIRVDGHTDTDPIQASRWDSNLRLSAERSLSVASYLKTAAGIPEDRISVAGYGPNRPRNRGTTAEAKRENRRVEILLLHATGG
jgi:chemotaxis protein MotB